MQFAPLSVIPSRTLRVAVTMATCLLVFLRSVSWHGAGPVKAARFLAMAGLILAGIIYFLSRMGHVASLVALFVMGAVPFGARLSPGKRWIAIGGVALVLASFALLPLYRLLMRFAEITATDTLSSDARVELWGDPLPLIAAYPVFGCGLGGFESALRKFMGIATRLEFSLPAWSAPGAFEGQVSLVEPNSIKVDAVTGTLPERKSPCAERAIFAAVGGRTSAIVILRPRACFCRLWPPLWRQPQS